MRHINSITNNGISKITVNTVALITGISSLLQGDKIWVYGMGSGVGWVVLFKVR